MATNLPYPVALSAPLTGVVSNPALSQNNDSTSVIAGMGRSGEMLISDVHGSYYQAAARGNVFMASANNTTGVAILAPGGTTSGFMFYNPVGSGVNMEILELIIEPLTATDVVGNIGLEFGAPPTTVANADSVRNGLIGGTSLTPQCKASHGSTIVAMTFYKWLPIFVQTVAGVLQGSFCLYNPWGSLVLAPGGAVNIVSSTTQGANLWSQTVVWAEWKV